MTGKTIRDALAFKNKGYLFFLHSNPESNANTLVKFIGSRHEYDRYRRPLLFGVWFKACALCWHFFEWFRRGCSTLVGGGKKGRGDETGSQPDLDYLVPNRTLFLQIHKFEYSLIACKS